MKQEIKAKGLEPIPPKKKIDLKIDHSQEENNFPLIEPSNSSLKRLNKFDEIIENAAIHYGVDKNLIKSVILTESAGNEKAISSAKAKGLMQLMDATAKDLGVNNVWDPKENIMGGTKYLAEMLRQYNGDLKLALAGYNAGPGNVQKYNGIPPFEETKNYITRVIGYMNHLNRI
jgi:soluble lytic murein transglycosylase-like protein